MAKKDTILVICAHNDDQIVGAGGTMAKYKEQGKNVKTVVFSYGERSHPHLKRHIIRKERSREACSSDKIIGCDGIEFLDVPEGRFLAIKEQLRAREMLKGIIEKEKPTSIFTHNMDDPHPDHRAVLNIVLDVTKLCNYSGAVYTFNVWNPLNFRKRNSPKLVIDITDTLSKKVKAFLAHKSQRGAIISLLWSIYFQAFMNGHQHHLRYAEVFYRIR